MRVDLHTHTTPASSCSQTDLDAFFNYCLTFDVSAIALTNHGDVSDNITLEPRLARIGVKLIHGVEISTLFGDFIIYSPDLEYLATFTDLQAVPKRGTIPDSAAIVWVHPAAGGGRSGSTYYTGLATTVGPLIDGVEVYNGNWASDRHIRVARTIAESCGVAMTGGSDAHRPQQIGRCATDFACEIASTADVVQAIKERATVPATEIDPRGRLSRLFGP
jgi:predicted metal-dependent phosphoesterase TrpH